MTDSQILEKKQIDDRELLFELRQLKEMTGKCDERYIDEITKIKADIQLLQNTAKEPSKLVMPKAKFKYLQKTNTEKQAEIIKLNV